MRRRLGRKLDRKERFKALPDRYPNEGPCDLVEAYDELTKAAFAVWIRLAVADRADLRIGRGELSKLLGYSRRQGDEVLRELERKGFIGFVPHGPWRRTIIVILRKPLQPAHGFTRFGLSLLLGDFGPDFLEQTQVLFMSTDPENAYAHLGGVTHLPVSFSQLPVSVTHLPESPSSYQMPFSKTQRSLGILPADENRNRAKNGRFNPTCKTSEVRSRGPVF